MHHFLFMAHLFALTIGLGASICGTVFTVAAARMTQEDSASLMMKAGPLFSKVGAFGLVLLIVTGGAMIASQPGMVAAGGNWFLIKMVFVVAAVGIVGFIHMQQARLKRGGDAAVIRPKLRLAVRGSLLAASGALVCAVIAFH